MADATLIRPRDEVQVTLDAAAASGEIYQLGDGRAAYMGGLSAAASGDRRTFITTGQVTVTKTTSVYFCDGARVYWDHSANSATYKKVNDRDFYIGRAVGDAAAADTTMAVNLNVDPKADIDLLKDAGISVAVGTAAAGGFGYPVMLGGAAIFELTATNEAQKIDLLSVEGFAKGANAIVDLEFRVISDGSGSAVDFSLGVANGTHATDADSITESIFVHLDANNTNINLESDDGTTEVAATDSTYDYTEGSSLTSRVYVTMDMRNPADVQIYVNGVLALGATVFNVDAATGPFYLLAHLEKTSSTDTYKVAVDRAQARFMQI